MIPKSNIQVTRWLQAQQKDYQFISQTAGFYSLNIYPELSRNYDYNSFVV